MTGFLWSWQQLKVVGGIRWNELGLYCNRWLEELCHHSEAPRHSAVEVGGACRRMSSCERLVVIIYCCWCLVVLTFSFFVDRSTDQKPWKVFKATNASVTVKSYYCQVDLILQKSEAAIVLSSEIHIAVSTNAIHHVKPLQVLALTSIPTSFTARELNRYTVYVNFCLIQMSRLTTKLKKYTVSL